MHSTPFLLTSVQVLRAILELDGEKLALRTLASWADAGVVVPHVWPRKRGRYSARGYSLLNLAQARLALHLRRLHVGMDDVRAILSRTDVQTALRPKSRAELVIAGRRVRVREAGADVDLEVPDGQLCLRFSDVMAGNRAVAERVRAIA